MNIGTSFKHLKHDTILKWFSFIWIFGTLFAAINYFQFVGSAATPMDYINLTFLTAAIMISGLVGVSTILQYDLSMKTFLINESDKRLEKFYIPTKLLIENITENNYTINDENRNQINNIKQYKVFAKEKTCNQFTCWADMCMLKTCNNGINKEDVDKLFIPKTDDLYKCIIKSINSEVDVIQKNQQLELEI